MILRMVNTPQNHLMVLSPISRKIRKMQSVFTPGFLKRILQVLLSASLFAWLFSIGFPAYASPIKPQSSSSSCPVLPAHFDFAHASRQELRAYHIPSPPATSDQHAIAKWLKDVQGIKKIVCLPDTYSNPITYKGKSISSTPALVNCATSAPSGTECGYNWTGYVVTNGTQGFNDVYGTWIVPCTTGSAFSAVSDWVGLGGYAENNLWQAGSSWDPSHGYTLWYEAVGTHGTVGEQEIVSTSCGETIHAEVWFAPNNTSSNVGVDILDVNTDTIYTKYAPSGFHSGYLTAEWIDERPACGNSLFGLADYHTAYWSDSYASANDATAPYYSIGHFAHTRIWMANTVTGARIARADVLGSNNGSGTDNFQSYWEDLGDPQCG